MKIFFKALLFLFLGIIALFVISMICFYLFVHFNNTEKKNTIKVLKAPSVESPKVLVVYQPSLLSSITKNMSYNIARGLNNKGYEVTLTYPGEKVSADISKYNIIIFGSPIYIGQPSSVLVNYIKRINSFKNKKIVLFVTGANDDSIALNTLEKPINGANSIKKIQLKKGDENKALNLGVEIGER